MKVSKGTFKTATTNQPRHFKDARVLQLGILGFMFGECYRNRVGSKIPQHPGAETPVDGMVTEVCRFPPTGLPYSGRQPAGGSKELPCVDILRAVRRWWEPVEASRGASSRRIGWRLVGRQVTGGLSAAEDGEFLNRIAPSCFRKLAVTVAGQVLAMKWGGLGRGGSLLGRVFLSFCQASSFPSRPNGRCKMGGVIESTSYLLLNELIHLKCLVWCLPSA